MNSLKDHPGKNASATFKPEDTDLKKIAAAPKRLLLSAAVFGIIFAYLFKNQNFGLNILVFVLLVYGFALINRTLFIKKTFRQEKIVTLFFMPVIFLSVYVFIGSTVLNILSILVILFLLFLQFLVLSDNAMYLWYQPAFFLDIFYGVINRILLGMGYFIAGSVNSLFNCRSEKKIGAIIGVLIGIIMLILIIPILIAADAKVSMMVSQFFKNICLDDVFLYILLFFIGASTATALVATAGRDEFTGIRKAKKSLNKRPIQCVTMLVALSMISVVYILFAIVQFTYFFETQQTIVSVFGLTSSAYAVRGFGELLFITCINFIIIAVAMRFTKLKDGRTPAYLKVLYTVLIAFNFIIMASAQLRMQYYESAYGYTIARFLSHSFMVFLVILNVIMLLSVYIRKIKILKLVILSALLFFCIIVALNPELFVARQNIERYEKTGKIDTAYLFMLSGDALCEACDFAQGHPEMFDDAARDAAQAKLLWYQNMHYVGWQSLNIADKKAYSKLQHLFDINLPHLVGEVRLE
ncbi:MAG: DUF4173 domain-containing protein [Christensenellales bacterium]